MKKLLSFLAGIAVVGSSLLGAVGCKGNGLFGKDEKKSLTGTTAAKIALARERLDESVFSEEMSFWETQESAVAVKSNEIAKSGVTRLSAKRAKSRAVAVEKGGATEQNGYTVEDGKAADIKIEKGKIYCVHKGTWHYLELSSDALLIIVENKDVFPEDTERMELECLLRK